MEVIGRIGTRVKQLREERAWTQQALADKAGASQPTIAGIESGTQLPGTALLGRLAELFRVDLDFFYRSKENPFEALLRAEEVKPEIRDTLREFTERCMRYREIEQAAGIEPAVAPAYAPHRGSDLFENAEHVAEDTRRRLDLGSQTPRDLADILERDGLRAMSIDTAKQLDGLFLFAEGEGGFALVDGSGAPERQLFTLAHEYGHFLMHRQIGHWLDYDTGSPPRKGDRVEMAANSFAAAFLMPKSAIESWWISKGKDNIAEIAGLRRALGVSYRALGWRLVALGLMPKTMRDRLETSEDAFKNLERRIYGTDAPTGVRIPEFSDRQRYLALLAYQKGEATVSKLAQWLETDVVEADQIAKALTWEEEPRVPAAN